MNNLGIALNALPLCTTLAVTNVEYNAPVELPDYNPIVHQVVIGKKINNKSRKAAKSARKARRKNRK